MTVYGLDPGWEKSALVGWDGAEIVNVACFENEILLQSFRPGGGGVLVIEKIESFGMAVGATVFKTVYESGRFAEAWFPGRVVHVTRKEVKLHICGTTRGTDATIRQALIDRFGPSTQQAIGTKKTPGPLYQLKGHLWQAFAVAVTWHDLNSGGAQ